MTEIEKDAMRWRKVRALTQIEIDEMDEKSSAAWSRLMRGGWWTKDLDDLIDALDPRLAEGE